MKMSIAIMGGLILALVAGTAAAQSMPAQAQPCVACHGNTGVSASPEWPNLAGQHEEYLALQLQAFRDGTRENPAMAPFVNNLSDNDIAVLASYYAGQERSIAANGDASLVAQGHQLAAYCGSCHGMRGVPAAESWPVLAGQHASYLHQQMLAFKHDERIQPLMQAALVQLGDPQFAALAAYYSQLKP